MDLASIVFTDDERIEAAERAKMHLLGPAIRAEVGLRSAIRRHTDAAVRGSLYNLAAFIALTEQHEDACIAIVKAERHIAELENRRG